MHIPIGETLAEKVRIHQEELTEVQMDIEQLRKNIKKKIDVLWILCWTNLLVIGLASWGNGIHQGDNIKTTVWGVSIMLWLLLLPKFIRTEKAYYRRRKSWKEELKKLEEREEILRAVTFE